MVFVVNGIFHSLAAKLKAVQADHGTVLELAVALTSEQRLAFCAWAVTTKKREIGPGISA